MPLALSSRQGRLAPEREHRGVGHGILDSTIVTVAAPRISQDLGGGFAAMQWASQGCSP
jgi:hypothetical protein